MRGTPMNLSAKLPIVCKKCIVSMICIKPCGKAHNSMNTIALTRGINIGVATLTFILSLPLSLIFDKTYLIYYTVGAIVTLSLILAVILEIQRSRLSKKFYPLMEDHTRWVGF